MTQTVKYLPTMRETRIRSLGWEDPPEKGTATHSSILTWRIPWTEEPGELQSMGRKESDITEQLKHTLEDNKRALKHCVSRKFNKSKNE